MNALTGMLGKAIIKSKTANLEKSMSEAWESSGPAPAAESKSPRKAFTKDDKGHYAHASSEYGNTFSILEKGKRWVQLSDSEGLLVENFVQKAYPVTAYRCTGIIRTSASLKQVVQIIFSPEERRKWDLELSKHSTLLEVAPNIALEWSVFASTMGGLVSGRDYVDVRSYQVEANKWARVWWGSVLWDPVLDGSAVRGWNYPQGFSFEQLSSEGEYRVRLTLHRDVKGWLPYAAAEQAMPSAIVYMWKALQMYLEKQYPFGK